MNPWIDMQTGEEVEEYVDTQETPDGETTTSDSEPLKIGKTHQPTGDVLPKPQLVICTQCRGCGKGNYYGITYTSNQVEYKPTSMIGVPFVAPMCFACNGLGWVSTHHRAIQPGIVW